METPTAVCPQQKLTKMSTMLRLNPLTSKVTDSNKIAALKISLSYTSKMEILKEVFPITLNIM